MGGFVDNFAPAHALGNRREVSHLIHLECVLCVMVVRGWWGRLGGSAGSCIFYDTFCDNERFFRGIERASSRSRNF